MTRAPGKSWIPSGPVLALAAWPLFALPACSDSAKSPVAAVDAARDTWAGTDTAVPPGASDANRVEADARVADDLAAPADVLVSDAGQPPADAVLRDTTPFRPDSGAFEAGPTPDAAVIRADSAPPEAQPLRDAANPDNNAIVSADGSATDATGRGAETPAPSCKLDGGAAPFVHLTPLELNTLLASAEDPFLINVKGATIGLIPGTDAVLANDLAGIEALVGGDRCADIILYCLSGATSQSVGNQLIANGYLHVRDLAGGITAWKNAGYPTE